MTALSFRLHPLFLAILVAPMAAGSGYSVGTQSVSAQGTANANGAEAMDASVIFNNPAGMMNLQGTQFSAVGNYVLPDITFTQEGQATGNLGGTLVPITGSDGGEPIEDTFIPHFYFSHRLSDTTAVGLGVFVPFGANAEFSDDFVGRYYALSTELTTININPSFAVRVKDGHSFGFGLNAQYMDGTLRRKVYGPSVAGALGLSSGMDIGALLNMVNNTVTTGADGSLSPMFEATGDDIAFGMNVGYLYEYDEDTRVGLAWRSRIHHELEGSASLTQTEALEQQMVADGLPVEALASIAKAADARLRVDTPESLSFNIYHKITDTVALMSDVTWTKQSRLKEIVVEAQPITTTYLQTDWRTTAKISFGATWQVSQPFQLRAGYMYDESPISGPETTLPTLPDNDRNWFSLGAKWQVTPAHSLDFAYTYLMVEDRFMDRSFDSQRDTDVPNNPAPNNGPGSSAGTVAGNFESSAHLLGVQWNAQF
ncbi:MAG: transporter [Hahellaceae bacterium]|nr:transporter [Hahellaceae bacterium]